MNTKRITVATTLICILVSEANCNPQYTPGENMYQLQGVWNPWFQPDPNYFATGLKGIVDEFSGYTGLNMYDITRLPPPRQFDHPPVDDLVTTRIWDPSDGGTAIVIKNETHCDRTPKTFEFDALRENTASVSSTTESGFSLNFVMEWSIPLVGEIEPAVTFTETTTTTYEHSHSETLGSRVIGEYLVSPCKARDGLLVIEETERYKSSDVYGSLYYMIGPIRHDSNPNDFYSFDYPQYIGTLRRVWGTASWISRLDTDAGPERWIPNCELNCGGVSDGDIDDDGVPDNQDDDMDGDGITNDHDTDRDGDGVPDSSDPDDDNDGIDDVNDNDNGPDGSDDIDGDGVNNEDDFDVDGDGLPNDFETGPDDDLDGDGVLNKDDGDIDGDGKPNELDDTPYGKVPTLDVFLDGIWTKIPLY